MSSLKGLAAVSVTTTGQKATFPDINTGYTLLNAGSGAVFWMYNTGSNTPTDFAGTEAEIRALGGAKLASGELVFVPPGRSHVYLVCGSDTGTTATLRIEPGEVNSDADPATQTTLAALLAALGGGVTTGAIGAVNAGNASSGVILAAAATRRVVVLTNLSDTAVYVAVGAAAVSAQGIHLPPLVGTTSFPKTLCVGAGLAINAIAAGASKSVAYQTFSD